MLRSKLPLALTHTLRTIADYNLYKIATLSPPILNTSLRHVVKGRTESYSHRAVEVILMPLAHAERYEHASRPSDSRIWQPLISVTHRQ